MTEPANTPKIGSELRDQSLPFMFETDDDTYVLPINPESYVKELAPRAKIRLTQSGGYEDRTGWVLPKINIKGTFGYLGTYPGGNGKTLSSGVQMCGWDLYKELEAIFLSFYEQFGTNTDDGSLLMDSGDAAAKLRFYNFTDEDFYEIQISKFVITRNIQHRLLYKYDIQLTALRRLDTEEESQIDWLADQFDDLLELPSEAELTFWGQMLEGYKWASVAMTDVINDIGELQSTLSTIRTGVSAFRQGLSDLIATPFELIQEAINTVDSVLETITSLADLPHELIDHLRETKFALISYKSKKDLFSSSGAAASTTADDDSDIWEILTVPLPSGQITSEAGAVDMYDPEATLFDSSLENVTEVAALETAINMNDTLETLAARMLGDSTGWKRIALLNNLEYPYILNSDDPLDYMSPVLQTGSPSSAITAGDTEINLTGINAEPGDLLLLVEGTVSEVVEVQVMEATVAHLGAPIKNSYTTAAAVTRHEERLAILKPGDKIKIPGLKSNKMAIAAEGENRDFFDRLYGVDEALDADGNLMATTTGEPVVIGGMPNLQMQLRHRIITAIKELAAIGHPTYGSAHSELTGKGNMAVWTERAKLEGKITLLKDPRVRKVEKTIFVSEGTAIFLDADVVPINKEAGEKMRISVN